MITLLTKESLTRRIAVAAGREPADVIIRNGQIIDVFNARIIHGDLAVVDGVFAGIGRFEGREVIDAAGRYVCPGLIDGHVHVESAMVTPSEMAKVLLPHGVTCIIADPHEICNVAGIEGLRFMLEDSESIPMDIYFMLPSCVPATAFENAGAELNADKLAPWLNHPRVLGLGEVMDFPAVMEAREGMIEKLLAVHSRMGGRIDGHAAGLDATGINVYAAAGIRTDHECVTAEEAEIRLERGMYLMIREGSVAKDLKALLPVVTERNARRCLFVTDDKHLDDLLEEGSIDHNIRLAVEQGLPPLTAIQMASLNAAECFGLSRKGAIAPGYDADFLLLDLDPFTVSEVYKAGTLVAKKGKVIENQFAFRASPPARITQSVRLPDLTRDQLKIPLKGKKARLIGIIPDSLVTRHLVEEVTVVNGFFQPSAEKDQLKLAVIERHRQTGSIGLSIVKGLGLRKGAIASTVAHDSHNLIIAGTNDEDMIMAAREIRQMQGGLIVVADGRTLASLPLPIGGLMADREAREVVEELHRLNRALDNIGTFSFNPFLTLSFLALPVIPELKLTDRGLFDVVKFRHIEVEAEEAKVEVLLEESV